MAAEPKLILADEPTGNLDSSHGEDVMQILAELSRAGTTVAMVTHSTEYAKFTDRTIQLLDGRIVGESQPATTHV